MEASGLKRLLTQQEAAERLAVCQRTIWLMTKRGELPVVRIGRAARYDLADVDAFIARRKAGAA